MSMPYRYQQILTVLRDHPDGLTSKQVYGFCKDQPGNELPDSTITGQCIYSLNKVGRLITINNPDGPNTHKITQVGREYLAKNSDEPAVKIIDSDDGSSAVGCKIDLESKYVGKLTTDEPVRIDDIHEMLQEAKIMLGFIGTAVDAMAKPIQIDDKDKKMATLAKLAALPVFTQDITDILWAIKLDIERLGD